MDKTDRLLMQTLQKDARLTSGELAQAVHLSQSPTWRRVHRLEEAGVISGYHAGLDRRALGYGMLAFVMISIDHHNDVAALAFQQSVTAIPEVVMFHAISGPDDFMLVVVARDLDNFSDILHNRLHRLPGVRRVHTHFSLKPYKEQIGNLPVPMSE